MSFHKFIYWLTILRIVGFLIGPSALLNNISRHVNDIVETIPDTEFDEFSHHRGLI